MSAIKVNGTWKRVSSIKIKQSGAWVDHAALYAKSEGAWHLIDLSAEPQDPAYHVWKAYADDATGSGISLEPAGKVYIGFATGKRTETPDLSDPSIFDWSLIKGEDGQDVDEEVLNSILEKQDEFPVLVDDVESRLKAADAALSSAHNTLDASVQAQDDLIGTLSTTLDGHTAELSALDTRVTDSISSVNASINAVALDLGGVKDDVTGLVSITSGNESKIASLETTSSDQAQRVTILETSNNSSKARIASLESTSAGHASRLNSLGVWDGENYSSITSLEEATADNATSISSLETSGANATSRITSLEETDAEHASRLTGVETKSTTNANKVSTLESTSADQASRLTTVETKASANESSVSALEQTSSGHASRLTNVETKATTAVSKANAAQDDADDANAAVTATTNRVSTLEETSGGHASRLTNVETKSTTAVSKANAAQTSADNAQADADTANSRVTTTTNRVSTLEETSGTHASRLTNVETKSTTAVSKANAAQSAADAAQDDADDANAAVTATTNRVSTLEQTTGTHASRLTNVETKATTAVSDASDAQNSADNAQTDANAAQTSADNAQTSADNAQTDADTANTKAENAQGDADTANSRVTATTNRVSTLEETSDGHASRLTNVETVASGASDKAANNASRVATLESTSEGYASRLSDIEVVNLEQLAGAKVQSSKAPGASWPHHTTIEEALELDMHSEYTGKAALRVQLYDAEDFIRIGVNGEDLGVRPTGGNESSIWYEYLIDVTKGNNVISFWADGNDGGKVMQIELRGGDVGSSVSTLEQATDTHASRLSSVETKATTAVSKANDAQGDADTANSRVTATTNRVSTLEETSEDHASRLTSVETESGENASKVSTLEETTADNASRIETVNTTQGKAVASAIDTAKAYTDSETGTLKAERVIKAEANGRVSGIHLLANGSGAEAGGKLYFQADEIAIVPPNWNGSSELDKSKFPFYFSEDRNSMYLDEATIKKLSAEIIDSGRLVVDGLSLMTKDLSLPAGAITGDMLDASFKDGLVRVNPNATTLGGTVSKEVRGVAYGTSLKLPALKSGGNIHTINARIVAPNGNDRISGHINISLFVNGKALKFNDGSVEKKVEIDIEKKLVGGPSQYYVYVSSVNFSERIETPPRTSGADYVYEMRVVGVHVNDPSYAAQYSLSFSASEPVKSSGGFITDVNWDEVKGKPSLALASQVLTNVPRGAKFTDTNTWRGVSSSVSSTSTSVSASSKAVKTAYDRGTSALNVANGKLGAGSKAVDSDKLDGLHASSFARVSHDHNRLIAIDRRDVKPDTSGLHRVKGMGVFFTSREGLTGARGTDYQDLLVLDTYADSSGGRPNALAFDKSSHRILHYVAPAYGGGTWGSAKTIAYVENTLGKTAKAVDSDKLDGLQSTQFVRSDTGTISDARLPSTISSSITGNAATATKLTKINTTFGGKYPMVVNVSGVLYSNSKVWFEGSTGQLTAPTFVGSLSGNSASASKWASARTITLAGDASGSVSIDGASNRTLTIAVANDSHTHDGRYFTEAEANSRFAYKSHTHAGHDVKTLGHRLSVDSDGKIRANNSGYRRAGMYGIYESSKVGHIWSMGNQYQIEPKGLDFGNLYGLAYKHTNNATGGTMAGGHQMVWVTNGTPKAAMGESGLWSSGVIKAKGYVRADGGLIQGGHTILNGSDTWIRTKSSDGIYFSSYGGGWRMMDSTWIRAYGGKALFVESTNSHSIRTNGGVLASKGLCRDNKGSSWISQRDSRYVGIYNGASVSNNSYAAVIRQRHTDYTWTVGGLGNQYFGIFAYTNGRTTNGTDGHFRMDVLGNCTASGTMKAKATNGTISRVITYDDFLPSTPPAGLENTITANWIGAGAINARHLQVNSLVNNGGTYTSFKVAPDASRPLSLSRTDSSGKEVSPIFYVDTKGNGFFDGKLSRDTVDIESIQDEARKQINPYYLGTVAGGSQSAPATWVNSGAAHTLPKVTVLGGKVNMSWKFSASDIYYSSGSSKGWVAPTWRVEVFRGSTRGTRIVNRTYSGAAYNVLDREPGQPISWEGGYSIHIEDQFTDLGASTSQRYVIRVTKVSGPGSTLHRNHFTAKSPAFKQLEVGCEYKTLFYNASGLDRGTIRLSENYSNFDFLMIEGVDDGNWWAGASILPTKAIPSAMATRDDAFEIFSSGSLYWRAKPNGLRSFLHMSDNCRIKRIWGVRLKEKQF